MIPGRELKWQQLQAELNTLLYPQNDGSTTTTDIPTTLDAGSQELPASPPIKPDEPFKFNYADDDDIPFMEPESCPHIPARRIAITNQYDKWKSMIPTVIQPYIMYLAHLLGKTPTSPPTILSHCEGGCDIVKKSEITALFNDCKIFAINHLGSNT